MTDRLYDELDRAIEAIVRGANEVAIRRDIEPLVAVAAGLRGLPRPRFKEALLSSLLRRSTVIDIIPYLVTNDVDGLIGFVRNVLGAEELMRSTGGAGGVHAEVVHRGRKVMIGGAPSMTAVPASLHVFVDDVDTAFARATAAGASPLHAPVDQEYGLREASIQDAFGNQWYLAQNLERDDFWADVPPVMPYFHPAGAARMIDFLRDALGAEVVHRFEEKGTVAHARLRVGGAIVEMGEAHGAYPAMPMHLYVSVDDADAAYARALTAGAASASAPADAPYGRVGSVDDPFGNRWYFVAQR